MLSEPTSSLSTRDATTRQHPPPPSHQQLLALLLNPVALHSLSLRSLRAPSTRVHNQPPLKLLLRPHPSRHLSLNSHAYHLNPKLRNLQKKKKQKSISVSMRDLDVQLEMTQTVTIPTSPNTLLPLLHLTQKNTHLLKELKRTQTKGMAIKVMDTMDTAMVMVSDTNLITPMTVNPRRNTNQKRRNRR